MSIICQGGVHFTHTPHPYTPDRTDPYRIVALVTSMGEGGIVPGTPSLHYRVDGGAFHTLPLDETGSPDQYAAEIPPQGWGSEVEYYLAAENDEGEPGTCPRRAPDSCQYFRVDNEFSDALERDTAWTVGAPGDDAATGIWTRADPIGTIYNAAVVQPEDDHTPDPGVACFVTGNGPVGGAAGLQDVDRGRITLLTPVFDLTGGRDITIGYWRWYTNNLGYNPNQDIWRVDVTNDGGESWTAVEYHAISSNAWEEVTFDLATYFPEPGRVRLRFIAEDVGGGSLVEALVDDFVLTGEFGGSAGIADGPSAPLAVVRLAGNVPNPFKPTTRIAFNLDRQGPVSLAVYDAGGRLVDVLVDRSLPRGEHVVVWDGTGLDGRAAASGVYYYVLESGQARLARPMTLIR